MNSAISAMEIKAPRQGRGIIPVPAEFLKLDTSKMAQMIAIHLLTFVVPLVLATSLLTLGLPGSVTIPAITVLSLISSFGLHSLGLMGHEGTHFTLHPKRIISAYIGVITSALVPFHLDMGFAIRHNQHHRFTNTDKDPDLRVFGRYNNLWSRLFQARLKASQEYLVTTLQLASGRYPEEWNSMLNLSRAQITTLARVNIVASLLFLSAYIGIAMLIPSFLIAFVAVFLFAILVSGLRPYLEHAGTDVSRFTSSRSWISPLFNAAYGGINYHLAHHLSPGVPAYNIAGFHRWLIENQYIQESNTVHIHSVKEAVAVVRNLPYGRL